MMDAAQIGSAPYSGPGRIRHVVMWTLKDAVQAREFKALLESCASVVEGIEEFDVGIAQPGLEASCDVVLISTFANQEALKAYQAHPHHQAVALRLGAMRQSRQVLDYAVGPGGASSP
jgi:hypothetical protein